MTPKDYRQCTRCIMDTTASDIAFDELGHCNYCTEFVKKLAEYQPSTPAALKARLEKYVARIKADGAGKKYDCVVGLSGGADSAYTLYLAKQLGLRPLAVHMDNGWDSELAVQNVENLVRKLQVDLHTHVINWQEYKNLMQAFLDADVLDVELLYDNAMLAVNYQTAAERGIKWILGGTNTTTEGMRMPLEWNWFKYDKKNIRLLARRAGVDLDTFPAIGTLDYIIFRFGRRITWLSLLDHIDYHKPRCTELLVKELGYRAYAYKHYESIFTRFYQGHILPVKFGVDKRKLHLSTLVVSKQMSREEAMRLMDQIPYPSASALQDDIDYFIKKMGWTQAQFEDYMRRPEIAHARYGTEKPLWTALEKRARKWGLL